MLPKFPRYGKNSLRPNASNADPESAFPFAIETILVGDFGDWGASPALVNGLPPARTPAEGKGTGWPPLKGDQVEAHPR